MHAVPRGAFHSTDCPHCAFHGDAGAWVTGEGVCNRHFPPHPCVAGTRKHCKGQRLEVCRRGSSKGSWTQIHLIFRLSSDESLVLLCAPRSLSGWEPGLWRSRGFPCQASGTALRGLTLRRQEERGTLASPRSRRCSCSGKGSPFTCLFPTDPFPW